MNSSPTWLLKHRRNVYSQSGEDGVIEKLLESLPARDAWCVEFGAWDGDHLSNTRNLIANHGYNAVLIEGNAQKYEVLARKHLGSDRVHTVCAFVGFRREDGLDSLLNEIPIPLDFDFLSVDIDGNDYHAWKAVDRYTPKIVCIEFNPTIPTEVDFIQIPERDVSHGASLKALVQLGKEKGYELVSVLEFNAIFVRKQFFPLLGISTNEPAVLRTDTSLVTWIFSGYDGRVFLRGSRSLPWHAIRLRESRIQHVPRFLMRYPDDFSWWQTPAFRIVKFVDRLRGIFELLREDPKEFIRKFSGKVGRKKPDPA